MKNTESVINHLKHNCLFVHIPKTAGTSFTRSIEDTQFVSKDYGPNSPQTSEIIKQYAYIKNDIYSLKKELSNKWLFGHFSLAKYINLVPIQASVSFVRSPIEQVISHYNHFVSYHAFKDDLATFLKRRGVNNIQHRLLAYLPLGLIGNVGIAEKFNESVKLINQNFKMDLATTKTNVNSTKTLTSGNIDENLRANILKLNWLDVKLYLESCFIHEQRVMFHNLNLPWVYAFANINSHKLLHGCAYYADNDDAVELAVHKNGQELKIVTANLFFEAYPKANFPRERYIGFHLKLPQDINSADTFDVYVRTTGQKVNYQALKMK